MTERNHTNITKYRRPLNLNIGLIIFAVIFVYIIICVFMYFTSNHIVGYEVKSGYLSSNNTYKGIALRDEEIITATNAGYINYYAREGARVGVGNLVYTVDQSGRLSEHLKTLNSGENSLSEKDLINLRSELSSFSHQFEKENFSDLYDFKYNMKGTVLKLVNSSILESLDEISSSGTELVNYCVAPQTGIVVYSVDGMENLTLEQMNSALFDTKNYEKTQLLINDLIASGDIVYKLSTKEDWSIVVQTDKETAEKWVEAEYLNIKFLKNQSTSWGKTSSYTNEAGETFVQFTFTNSMIAFCTDRYIDIEVITEEESGLKIPNSSIVEKEFFIVPREYVTKGGNSNSYGILKETYTEDGTSSTEFIETSIYHETETDYYISDDILRIGDNIIKPESSDKYTLSKRGSLIGVYNINKGYADFKQINILYQNEEYSIVRSNTQYGLSVYDYIVLDAETVNENELIYE